MKIRLTTIKAVKIDSRHCTLVCGNRFLRKRILEHLQKMDGVVDAQIAHGAVYMEVAEGISMDSVLTSVHMALPVFAGELGLLPPWPLRNFCLLWGLLLDTYLFVSGIHAYFDGRVTHVALTWICGLAVAVISMGNHQRARAALELRLAAFREACAGEMAREFLKEDGHGSR